MASQNRGNGFSKMRQNTGEKRCVLIRTFRGDVGGCIGWKEIHTMSSRLASKATLITTVAGFLMLAAWAQTASKTGPKYDVKNEVKVKGVIEETREVSGQFEGTLLVVKTDSKTVMVRVAPAAFLKEIDTSFNKGDQIEVVGCKAPDATEDEILAREITVGQNTTTLRDNKGVPIWAGWKPSGK